MRNSREKITASAVSVFAKRGYHQAQVEEIARRAGVGKGTVYLHFPNKAMLFAAAVSEGLNKIITEVERDMESELHFPGHMRLLIERNVSLHLKNGALSRIIFNELSIGIEPEAMKQIHAERERLIDFVAGMLEHGCKEGYIKPVEFRLVAVGIVGLMDGLCDYHLKNPREFGEDKIVEAMYAMLSSGLMAENKKTTSSKSKQKPRK